MKRPNQITAVLFLLFSALVIYESLKLRFYTSLGPGPGFFAVWIGVLVALLAAVMFYQATFRQPDPMPADFFPSRVGYLRMAAITAAFVWAVLAMNPLGFRLTMLAFFLFLLFGLGRVGWLVTALVAVAGSFGAFYMFDSVLKVPLPIGVFGV